MSVLRLALVSLLAVWKSAAWKTSVNLLQQATADRRLSIQTKKAAMGTTASCCAVPTPPYDYASPTFKYNIADFKVSTAPEHKYQARRRGKVGPLSEVGQASSLVDLTNYEAAMDALLYGAGMNGLRMPIIPLYTKPKGGECDGMEEEEHGSFVADGGDCSHYMNLDVHEAVYKYAKEKNIVIFASPMPDTNYGWTKMKDLGASGVVARLMDYVKHFVDDVGGEIHYLDPWNEDYLNSAKSSKSTWNAQHIKDVTTMLRGNLTEMNLDIKIVGPSEVMISKSEMTLDNTGTVHLFDVLGAHTQTEDVGSTEDGWAAFKDKAAGRPVWNTEGMTETYNVGDYCTGTKNDDGSLKYSWCDPCEDPSSVSGRDPGARPSMDKAVLAGVEGWVHWGTTGDSGFVKPSGGHLRQNGRGRHIMVNLLKKADDGAPEACYSNSAFFDWWEEHKSNNDFCSPCPNSVAKKESCGNRRRKNACGCNAYQDIAWTNPCSSS